MRSLATWRVQKGTTFGLVEQLLGSSSLSGAFITQIKLHAYNVLGLAIVLLWCLSPLGGQASLRVATIVSTPFINLSTLTALDIFSPYQYGGADNYGEALTVVVAPFTAALMSTSLVQDRNQDMWGNIRLPVIERIVADDTNTSWSSIPDPTNVALSSLVGVPLAGLPDSGNTTFTLFSSYLSVACDTLEPLQGTSLTNYTNSSAPAPGGTTDCTWVASFYETLQVAASVSCDPNLELGNGSRDARRLVWESRVLGDSGNITHAECELSTTYVDVNMSCVGLSCSPSAIRRSPQPPRDRNWTVFDFNTYSYSSTIVLTFLDLFTNMFYYALSNGGQPPLISYFVDPDHVFSSTNDTPLYLIGKPAFELALTQLLNSQLSIGVSPYEITGNFNTTSSFLTVFDLNTTTITASTITTQDQVHCDRAWLVILLVSSWMLSLVALGGALVRLVTLLPDLLGTLSLAMLDNKCDQVPGNSTWSASKRTAILRDMKVQLGDINPDGDIGQIALGAPANNILVGKVQIGRLYR